MVDLWRGTYTALPTPFKADGSVDEPRLARLVDFQIDGGVEGLVPCGTTGESATLSASEQLKVIERVVTQADARVTVLAGAGGNSTERVLEQARQAAGLGVDGILSVVPYYNKPTQEGLYQHFSRLADAVPVPVIVYNVPGRTSCNLAPTTLLRLSAHGNIAGIKEASGNLPQVMEMLAQRPSGFRVLSGEDNLTLPLLALGADGVISVVANEVPVLMSRMVRDGLEGRWNEARAVHYRLLGLMTLNFVETNPIPVKAALAMMKLVEEHYRLPLVPLAPENRERLRKELLALELIEG
jgi:4-hydroxy-tetrahydrodipicolinate synthase